LKILSVADHVDPLVYSQNIKNRFRGIDCILGAGDLDISYYEYIISCLNKPLYFVFGNHNLKNMYFFRPTPDSDPSANLNDGMSPGFGSICVDGRVIRDKRNNLIIAGLGGSRKYNNGVHQFTEIQMYIRALRIVPRLFFNRIFRGRWLDILLTHATPEGIHDHDDPCHRGFKSFLWFMKKFKPKYLIHGHVHLYDINAPRASRYGDTTVLNAYDHIVIDLEKGMQESPYVVTQAESDFTKARQKAWIQSLKLLVNPAAGQLLSFHDIKGLLKPGKEKYLGMKAVPIEDITGSEDRYQDFSRHFFPKKEHLRHRWMSIDKAHLTDVNLPAIKLLKLGDMYFVRDGNHRVSVARSQGVMTIDAEVIELTAEIEVDKTATRDEILKAVIGYERRSVLEQTDLERIIPVEMIEFTSPGRWHEILNHIEGHKYFINLNKDYEIPFPDAARSWYNTLYVPVVEIIRNENLIARFPNRTEADLYLWVIKHWHSLKEKYGPEYPLDQAASEYAAAHGKSFSKRMGKRLKQLFGIGN
jgi:hypothetical protein